MSHRRGRAVASFGQVLEKIKGHPETLDGLCLENRNKAWVGEELIVILGDQDVAFTLIVHPWMQRGDHLVKEVDPVTTDFLFVTCFGTAPRREGLTMRGTR